MKILIAYYSKSGSTGKIAQAIKKELEIRGYYVDTEIVMPVREHNFFIWWHLRMFLGECPIQPLKIKDVSKYDVICVGSPNWTRLSLPMARYLKEVTGLRNKSVGFFCAAAAPPTAEWYLFSAYLLDLSLSKIIEKKRGRIVNSILLSSVFKRWGSSSDFGRRTIKKFCDEIESPAKPLKEYTLKQKEIEESRSAVAVLMVFNVVFLASQSISAIIKKQILSWPEFFIFLAVSLLSYFAIITILERKKAIFLVKYIIIITAISFWTLAVLFFPGTFGHMIILGYLLFFMLVFFFRNVRAVVFSGVLAIFSYAFLFSNYQLAGYFSPVWDIIIIALGFFIASFITGNLRDYFLKLLEAQDEADEARISLEVRIAARTRELKELADGLEGKVKIRTVELQEKIKELEKFNSLAVGRELKMVELKNEIEKLREELKK
ncbi:MAG: hypothetical protein ABH813_01295 [Patescibacteria group bacterium]